MKIFTLRAVAVGLLLAGAAPALAQAASPADGPGRQGGRHGEWRGHGGNHIRGRAFASLSPEGRTIMRDAMRGGIDRREDREGIRAARDRMLAVLDADKLDTGALKRAMDDERDVVNAGRERTQAAMLAGFAKLTVADRKAFVADARALRKRMEDRVKQWRERGGKGQPGRPMGGPEGAPGLLPPPGF